MSTEVFVKENYITPLRGFLQGTSTVACDRRKYQEVL